MLAEGINQVIIDGFLRQLEANLIGRIAAVLIEAGEGGEKIADQPFGGGGFGGCRLRGRDRRGRDRRGRDRYSRGRRLFLARGRRAQNDQGEGEGNGSKHEGSQMK